MISHGFRVSRETSFGLPEGYVEKEGGGGGRDDDLREGALEDSADEEENLHFLALLRDLQHNREHGVLTSIAHFVRLKAF